LDIPAKVAVIPRLLLDNLLLQHACNLGVDFIAPLKFIEPWIEDGFVRGAILKTTNKNHLLRSNWVVLATGAQPQSMQAAALCQRRSPSGIALRGYIRHTGMTNEINTMQFICNKALKNGYGWIFPGPDGIFNIGVGFMKANLNGKSQHKNSEQNLNQVFKAFCENYPPAAKLVEEGLWLETLRGAPLRCSLTGSKPSRPGLLATGEAIGSTYSLTGEGIGKALETGILCADSLLSGQEGPLSDKTEECVRQHYESRLRKLLPKYKIYERAAKIYAYPWLINILIWRARHSPKLLQHMAGVISETSDPSRLFTWRGLRRILLG
jgi:flavin-dependent dehydrogenase